MLGVLHAAPTEPNKGGWIGSAINMSLLPELPAGMKFRTLWKASLPLLGQNFLDDPGWLYAC